MFKASVIGGIFGLIGGFTQLGQGYPLNNLVVWIPLEAIIILHDSTMNLTSLRD